MPLSGWGDFNSFFDEAASAEEEEPLENGGFICRIGRALKITCCIMTPVTLAFGLFIIWGLHQFQVGLLFLILSAVCLVLLPPCLTYKLTVDKERLREEFWIIFIKIKKEIKWSDIKYKKITYGKDTKETIIRFYDINKKKLTSLDSGITGFHRILKMAKRRSIKELAPEARYE